MEHQLSNAGLSIESVPEFQYWMWRLRPIVGCRRSRWAWWQLYRWVVCCLSWAWTYVRVASRVSWVLSGGIHTDGSNRTSWSLSPDQMDIESSFRNDVFFFKRQRWTMSKVVIFISIIMFTYYLADLLDGRVEVEVNWAPLTTRRATVEVF
jgi:hypothetical protein